MDIRIKRGLKLSLRGAPTGQVVELSVPKLAAVDVSLFDNMRLQVLVKPGDRVLIGDPVLEDKQCAGRLFTAPVSGTVTDIVRGSKRRILHVVIKSDSKQRQKEFVPIADPTREELVQRFLECGLFGSIEQRPLRRLADPHSAPEAIFISAVNSAPYRPMPEHEVEGHEDDFAAGIKALHVLTDGPIHLIHDPNTTCRAFKEAKANCHTITGLHPKGNFSIHIAYLHPIKEAKQNIWTLTVHEVIRIGAILRGKVYNTCVIGLGGEGVQSEYRKFYRVNVGHHIPEITNNAFTDSSIRIISGDPLTGARIDNSGFLGAKHDAVSVMTDRPRRTFLHFLRLGTNRPTLTNTYLSTLRSNQSFPATTQKHGEKRAFVDGGYYDRFMPLRVPTMPLIKALIAEDFDKALALGLLEVDPEDFAPAAFICPSKIAMPSIVREAQKSFLTQYLN